MLSVASQNVAFVIGMMSVLVPVDIHTERKINRRKSKSRKRETERQTEREREKK